MEKVYIGLGSNYNAEVMLKLAYNCLLSEDEELSISSIYKNPDIRGIGADFYNTIVSIRTNKEIKPLKIFLQQIEQKLDPKKGQHGQGICKIDLDLLLYGNKIYSEGKIKIPHPDILKFNFIAKPLAEITPNEKHPIYNVTYSEIWRKNFSNDSENINVVEFKWN